MESNKHAKLKIKELRENRKIERYNIKLFPSVLVHVSLRLVCLLYLQWVLPSIKGSFQMPKGKT